MGKVEVWGLVKTGRCKISKSSCSTRSFERRRSQQSVQGCNETFFSFLEINHIPDGVEILYYGSDKRSQSGLYSVKDKRAYVGLNVLVLEVKSLKEGIIYNIRNESERRTCSQMSTPTIGI